MTHAIGDHPTPAGATPGPEPSEAAKSAAIEAADEANVAGLDDQTQLLNGVRAAYVVDHVAPAAAGEPLRDRIEVILRRYRCQHNRTEDGDPLSLVDVLSPFDTVVEGQEEIQLIADDLAAELLGAAPSAERKGLGIYVASKTRYAPRWRQLRADGYPIISTWIDEAGPGETADLSEFWQRIVSEIASCERLILFAEEGEVLRGALIEVGLALAFRKPVTVFGSIPWASWQDHPLVSRVADEAAALRWRGPAALRARPGEFIA